MLPSFAIWRPIHWLILERRVGNVDVVIKYWSHTTGPSRLKLPEKHPAILIDLGLLGNDCKEIYSVRNMHGGLLQSL